MFPSYGEGATDIRKGLVDYLPRDALQQVEFVATDAPSKRLYEVLKEALPNLQALALDPVHLAMHYESASSRHKTLGSAALRRGLAKFSCCQGGRTEDNWGDFFTGEVAVRLTARESTLRSQILDGSMAKFKAQRLLILLPGSAEQTLSNSWPLSVQSTGEVTRWHEEKNLVRAVAEVDLLEHREASGEYRQPECGRPREAGRRESVGKKSDGTH
eukprot:s217_g26.t1